MDPVLAQAISALTGALVMLIIAATSYYFPRGRTRFDEREKERDDREESRDRRERKRDKRQAARDERAFDDYEEEDFDEK